MKKIIIIILISAFSITLKGQSLISDKIVAFDSNFSLFYAVSIDGHIYSSKNGSNWTDLDFNKYYEDYYEPVSFVDVAIAFDRVAVLGKEANGNAVLYISTKGNIWAARDLKYKIDNNDFVYLEQAPLKLSYDITKDEFIVLFEEGIMMTIPSCSHCNKLIK